MQVPSQIRVGTTIALKGICSHETVPACLPFWSQRKQSFASDNNLALQVISLLLAALYPAFAPNTGVELGQLGPSRSMTAILSPRLSRLLRLWLVSTRLARSLISK